MIKSASVILSEANGPRFLSGMISASVWFGLMNGFVVTCGTVGNAVDTLTSFLSRMSHRLPRVISSPAGCIGSSSSGVILEAIVKIELWNMHTRTHTQK